MIAPSELQKICNTIAPFEPHYTGQSHYSSLDLTTFDAAPIILWLRDRLVASGWREQSESECGFGLTAKCGWFGVSAPVSGTPIEPKTLVDSSTRSSFAWFGFQNLYWFDPGRETPTGPGLWVPEQPTVTGSLDKYIEAASSASAWLFGYFPAGDGSYIVIATAPVPGIQYDETPGNGLGSGLLWGYHAAGTSGNFHGVNGGYVLCSRAANGTTQYTVTLLEGGHIPPQLIPYLGPDYNTENFYTQYQGYLSVSHGQPEKHVPIVIVTDSTGSTVTFQIYAGWDSSQTSPIRQPVTRYSCLSNPYQFILWAPGWSYSAPNTSLIVSAPYVPPEQVYLKRLHTPGLTESVIAGGMNIFDSSEDSGNPEKSNISDAVNRTECRNTPAWSKTFAFALNGGFIAPHGPESPVAQPNTAGEYRGGGLLSLADQSAGEMQGPDGLDTAGTAYMLGTQYDDNSRVVGLLWDALIAGNAWGGMAGAQFYYPAGRPESPNLTSNLPDSTLERTVIFDNKRWHMITTQGDVGTRGVYASLWVCDDDWTPPSE